MNTQQLKTKLTTLLAAGLLPLTTIAAPTVKTSLEVGNKDLMPRGFIASSDPYMSATTNINGDNLYAYFNSKVNPAKNYENTGIYMAAGTTFKLDSIRQGASGMVEVGQLSLPNGQKMPEIYSSFSFNLPFNPSVEVVIGGKDFPGRYYSLNASQSHKFGDFTATLSGKLGVYDNYSTNYTGLAHATIDASLSRAFGKMNVTANLKSINGLRPNVPTDHSFSLNVSYKY